MCFQLVLEPFLWAALFSGPVCQLRIEHLPRDAQWVHADDVAGPTQLRFGDHCFDTGGAGSVKDFLVGDSVLPSDLHD